MQYSYQCIIVRFVITYNIYMYLIFDFRRKLSEFKKSVHTIKWLCLTGLNRLVNAFDSKK